MPTIPAILEVLQEYSSSAKRGNSSLDVTDGIISGQGTGADDWKTRRVRHLMVAYPADTLSDNISSTSGVPLPATPHARTPALCLHAPSHLPPLPPFT